MSRARELAKAGGVQQRIAGFSSHVGMSTFLAEVHMEDNLTVDGNIGVGGNLTVTGTTTFNGGTLNLGNAATDNVVFGGEVDSNIIPDDDNSFDLGSSTKEWKDLYVDGVAYLDSVESDGGSFGNIQVGETGDNEIDTGSGNLTIDSAGGTVTVDDNLTVAGTVTLNTTLADSNLSTISTAGKVDIGALEIDGATDIGADLADADLLIVDDGAGGTERKSTFTRVKKYIYSAASGDATASDSGVITLANSGVSAGTVGSSTAIPIITVDSKGRITNTSTTAVDSTTIENGSASVAVANDGPITSTGNHDFTAGIDVTGNSTFANNVTITGNTVVNGNTDLGNATSDTITATGRFDSNLVPSTDNARDLGSSTLEWKDLFIDGTAHIDTLDVDANAAVAGNIAVTGNGAVTGTFDVDGATTLDGLTVAEGASFSSTLDVDGATTLDGLTVAENATFSAAIDVDGHTNLDNVSVAGVSTFASGVTITGALDANGGASIDNIQIGVTNNNELDTSSGNLVIDSAGGTTTIDDNLTVSGNLTVNGTTTTINSTTVAIDDKNFQVATGAADDAAADGAGLTVDSGDGDKTFNFEATGDNWGASENLNLASGKVYKINNSSILSATTLGSSVVNSSLTTLGTISTGVWQGTAIANAYLANSTMSVGGVTLTLGGTDATPAFNLTDATNYPTSSLSGTITNAQLAGSIANGKLTNSTVSFGGVTLSLGGTDATPAFNLSDATNYPTSSLSGTITNAQLAGSIANNKLSTITAANKVSISALNIDGGTDIGAALSNADEIIVDDGGGGTNRRCDMSRVKTYIYGAMSGDATASSGGAVTLANSGVSAGTVGSSTAIPIITVDSKGRITNTSTTAVDSTTIENGSASVAVASNGPITSTGNHDFTAGIDVTGNITVTGTVDGADVASMNSKLSGIESGATADQTAAEIRALVESASNSNVFTDADHSKLNGIAAGATNVTNNNQLTNGAGYITAVRSVESVQDIVGGMLSGNTESGITVTYQDGDGTIDFSVASQTDQNFTNADHSKLDGIESGATADQTASEILTLLKTVDGAGSGLDADTLDGITSGNFLRSNTSDTFSGTLTMSGHIIPNANGTRDLGSSGTRWRNIYSSDLDLSNQAKGANSVDGTWGSYLVEEGEEHLFLTNRRSGKKYRFVLEEV